MKKEINVPKLGAEMQEAIISEWFVQVGDIIEVDTPLCCIEAEKMEAEIASLYNGVVSEIIGVAGETYEVGAVIGYIEEN